MSREHAGLACRRDPHRRTGSDERTPMPIAYMERPRQRQAQYPPYRWALTHDAPWTPLGKPLREHTLRRAGTR